QTETVVERVAREPFRSATECPSRLTDLHGYVPPRVNRLFRSDSRQTGALRPVDGFPARRLLWHLRRPAWSSADCWPWHPARGLPRSRQWTVRRSLGGGFCIQ